MTEFFTRLDCGRSPGQTSLDSLLIYRVYHLRMSMNIGALAKQGQVNIQTIRYYEKVGLLMPTQRRESGYRVYNPSSLERLCFIKRAQGLGFTLKEIKELLGLHGSNSKSNSRSGVRAKAQMRIADIREKIAALKKLEIILKKLIRDCENGADTGPCPILEYMAGLYENS